MRCVWVAVLLWLHGCDSTCVCEPGIWPVDGTTAVDPEVQIRVISDALDPQVLAMDAVVLEGPGGRIPSTVGLAEDQVWLLPDEPLSTGLYEVRVLQRSDLDAATQGHFVRDLGTLARSRSGTARFRVGSAPAVQLVFREGDDVYVRFSEPVDPTTVAWRILIDGEPHPVRHLEGRLYQLPDVAEGVDRITVLDGIEARSGLPVPAVSGLTFSSGWTVDRTRGAPSCGC